MLKLVLRRLGWSIPLLAMVTCLTFLLNAAAPGDAAHAVMGGLGTEEQYQAKRHELGLDQPLAVQYWHWVSRAVRGDLGASLFNGESVVAQLNGRIGVTVSLLAGLFVVCVVGGVSLGVGSALKGGLLGGAIDVLSMGGLIFPSYWVALVLMVVFAVNLQLFPATGYTRFVDSPTLWTWSLVLPVFALSLHGVTALAKQTRDAMSDVMGRDFIRGLRASGVPEWIVIFKHALRNAAIPTVTVLGVIISGALMGAVFVEKTFVLPGLGSLAADAAQEKDMPVLQGVAVYFTLITILVNLLVDVSYGLLNPKVRV